MILDLLFPPVCLVCDRALTPKNRSSSQHAARVLCLFCDPTSGLEGPRPTPQVGKVIFYPHCTRCGATISRSPGGVAKCVACQVWPPPFRYLRSVWRYDGEAEVILKAYKYKRARGLAAYLSSVAFSATKQYQQEIQALESCVAYTPDLIIPVPSSVSSLRQRGFGHMMFIAKILGKHFKTTVSATALSSSTRYEPQVQQHPLERYHNLEGRFRAKSREVSGKNILLLDDVLTSGASIWNSCWSLLDAGASSIDVVTFARSNNFQSLRLMANDSPQNDRLTINSRRS